jgi:AcrR family transcriptional regulator
MARVKAQSGAGDADSGDSGIAAAARRYAGQTPAERAATRRAALIDGAVDVIAADGWTQLGIERVCRRAGLNKRYFYESFADLDGLVAAVLDELAAGVIADTIGAMATPGPLVDVVRAGISALVHNLVDDPRRAHVLLGETASGETAACHRRAAIRRIVVAATLQGRRRLEADPGDELDLAAGLLVGGTRQVVLDWLDGRIGGELEHFIDELAALWWAVGDAAAGAPSRRT